MNIVFAGTPEIAASCLQALLQSKHNIVAAYTQPDRPKGRGKKLQASPVKLLAEANNIPVYQPLHLKDKEAANTIASLNADIMVVVAYGLILPENILQNPKHGCINVHTSLLPKYRGPAPAQHAILNGDTETGVTIMQMDKGLDTGAILKQEKCTIDSNDTSETLLAKLATLGANALLEVLGQIPQIKAEAQDESKASYAGKINKQDANIDWQQPAETIAHAIRAYQPWPVAYSEINDTRVRFFKASPIKLAHQGMPGEIIAQHPDSLDIACGSNVLRVTELQLPGKTPMSVQALLNGHHDLFSLGACFYANA